MKPKEFMGLLTMILSAYPGLDVSASPSVAHIDIRHGDWLIGWFVVTKTNTYEWNLRATHWDIPIRDPVAFATSESFHADIQHGLKIKEERS